MAAPFTIETVDDGASGAVHGELGLALDTQGNPSVAYARTSGQIMLARRDAGGWTREQLPGGSNAALDGTRICLAIDSQGNPHLAYQDLTGHDLIHAVKSGGQWTFTHVPTRLPPAAPPSGNFVSTPGDVSSVAFAIHPGRQITEQRDTPHFAYSDVTSLGLGYTHLGGAPFTPVPVAVVAGFDPVTTDDPRATETGLHVSMAFDPGTEEIHIAYVSHADEGGPTFVSVRRKKILDTILGTVSPASVIDASASINVLSTSIVRTESSTCVGYYDLANQVVKAWVASIDLPDGEVEVVETNIGNTVAPSAAANRGQFRVVYADTNAIKLASRSRSGSWTVEIVDPVSGTLPSLAYDNSGTANLAYATDGKLKSARRSE